MIENKKILFRADGNNKTGLGHLYRLISIYEMIKDEFQSFFLTKNDSETNIFPEDINIDKIPDYINIPEEPEWIQNKYGKQNIIIIDGYQFSSEYQKNIKERGLRLIYIDDLVKEYMFADIVVNHAPGIQKENYKSEKYASFALGTEFAILRPEFLDAAKSKRNINKIERAFVCFGGADKYHLTAKTVNSILKHNIKAINVVIGSAYKNNDIFKLQKENSKIKINSNISAKEIVKLMKASDFAVVPSSSVLYEALAVKMPVISGFYVENQEKMYNFFSKNGYITGLSNFLENTDKKLEKSISKIINLTPVEIKKIIEKQNNLSISNVKERYLKLIKNLCN